jgi:hypothetical protein
VEEERTTEAAACRVPDDRGDETYVWSAADRVAVHPAGERIVPVTKDDDDENLILLLEFGREI